MNICFECGKQIQGDDKVKMVGKRIIHTSCYRKYINSINGRGVLCSECDGAGYVNNPLSSNSGYTRNTNGICPKCNGNGYVSGN